LILVTLSFLGCADSDPPAMRTLVTAIATQEGSAAADATERLVPYGRRGLVVLEAALHTAAPPGRRRLVRAIRRLGDEDGAALLAHVARWDEAAEVRAEAKGALEAWAADRSLPIRAATAERMLAVLH
jgi:hypothetical protein